MTIKEIVKLTGKSETTIRRWISSAKMAHISAKMADAGSAKVPADFTLDETIAIIRAGGNHTLADLLKQNAEQDKKTALTKREIQMIQVAVRQVTEDIMEQINRTRPAKTELPPGKIEMLHLPSPEKNERDQLNQIIRKYASNQSLPHAIVWGQLYQELYYRLNINVRKRAQNRNMPIIDYIESEGMLLQALSVAKTMFR